jgi:hypothetical protein
VCAYRWAAVRRNNAWYAVARIEDRRDLRYMHRFILSDVATQIDHRDGDGLNNRRANLRPCTAAQNAWNWNANRRRRQSRFRGVHFDGRWVASIWVDGRNKSLGRFDSEELAAIAYNRAASELRGEFARLNEVEEASA